MKTISIICLLLLCIACTNTSKDKQAEEDKIQILMDRILTGSMSLDEKIELMNSHTLDSLPFERKKAFIIKFSEQNGWESDTTYTEDERDSIMMNIDIKEYIKLMWLSNELDTCTLK